MLIKLLIVFGLLLLISADMSFAQSGTGEGGSQNAEPSTEAQEPIRVKQPAYRWFFWPDEEPQNFNLSTMGHDNRGTTMGEKTSRRSNLEVNPMGEPETEKKQRADDQQEKPIEDTSALKPVHPPSDNPVIKWVDEEGNIHITNEPRNVPEDQLE